jgi:hypothetical protein
VSEVVRSRRLAADTVVDDGPSTASIGAVGGRLVHRVMERLDLTLAPLDRAAAAQALALTLAREKNIDARVVPRVSSVVARLAQHEVVERAADAVRAGRPLWREVPFAIRSGRTTTSGTIDLVFQTPAGFVVVDWKSDIPAPVSALRARYEAQLVEYARAVVKALDARTPVETVLAGPHPELPLDDDADSALLPDDARAVIDLLLARGVAAPVIGHVESGIETVCAWPEQKVALVDAADVLLPGFTTTCRADDLPALLRSDDDD